MILGALIDAGLDIGELKTELDKLELGDEYELAFTKSIKQGITGTQFQVKLNPCAEARGNGHEHGHDDHDEHVHDDHNHHAHHHHRTLADILKLIDESELDPPVKETAEKIFDRLAEAEAKIHNKTKDKIHFHEVGAIDSIIDIVGASIGLHLLEIEESYASKISLGSGFVKCAHGIMPVPAPATLELLKGVPVRQTSIGKELTTPTGAAIIATLAKQFGSMPEMVIDAIGYGAGQRNLDERPNLLRVCIGKKN